MTVVLALIGMILIPFNIFISIVAAAIFVLAAAVLASFTLMPAILSVLGDRINKLSVPFVGNPVANFEDARSGGFWNLVSRTVMRQPVISVLLAGGLLVAALVFFFQIQTGSSGVASFPDGIESKEGFQILEREFSAGEVTPAEIVIEGDAGSPAVQAAIGRLTVILETDPSFGRPKRMEPGSMTSNGDSSIASASRRFLSEESVRSSKPVPTLAA